jgi:hypothetical protein
VFLLKLSYGAQTLDVQQKQKAALQDAKDAAAAKAAKEAKEAAEAEAAPAEGEATATEEEAA